MEENMINKKIGTITFHVAHNYGAMLQAYALPKAIQSLGYDCEVIHNCFPYIYPWGHISYFGELCQKHGAIGGFLRWGRRVLTGEYSHKKKKYKFERFMQQTRPLSHK